MTAVMCVQFEVFTKDREAFDVVVNVFGEGEGRCEGIEVGVGVDQCLVKSRKDL